MGYLQYLPGKESSQQNPFWKPNVLSSGQEIPCFSWHSKAYYTMFITAYHWVLLPLIQNQSSSSQSFLRSTLILSSYLHLGLPMCLFPKGFMTKIGNEVVCYLMSFWFCLISDSSSASSHVQQHLSQDGCLLFCCAV